MPSAKRASRRASLQQHQREQAVHLGLVGHQLGERAAEPDRLGGEVAAPAVALVEDQVDDREHRGEPVGQQVRGRHAERDPGGPDLALRAHEPLRHRRLGDEEGARDLVGRQAAERPQRERDLRVERERRVAAGEEQLEPLVRDRRRRPSSSSVASGTSSSRVFAASVRSRRMRSIARLRAVVTSHARGLAGAPSRGQRSAAIANASWAASSARSKSPRKPIRAARTRPHSSRKTCSRARYHSTTGRTSIAPPRRAAGIRAASSIAASRSSASNTR